MTETENLRYIINKVLNNKEMYGGDGNDDDLINDSENSTSSNSFSSLSDSSDKLNNTDSDFGKMEKEKSSNYEKQYRQELNNSSENDSESKSSESEKQNKLKSSSSSSSDSDDSDNETKQDNFKDSEFSESSDFSESVSNNTTPEYQESEDVKNSRLTDDDEQINDSVLPNCLKSSRIQNIDKKNDFMQQISEKFPNLSNDGTSKSQVAILMRYILREVNKENPNLEDDEDKLFSLGQKYLKKMKEDDLDFDKFSEYDKNKKKARNLFIQMLYKIHKINPKLSYGKPNDNRVYDTVIVRSAAFKKAHEEYPDLPRLEFIQKVYDMLTPDFVNSVDIEQEKQNYEDYMKSKGKTINTTKPEKTKTKKTTKKKAKK